MSNDDRSREIPERLYFRIGDVADLVGVKPYVLRYWESEFSMISPEKSSTGQRVYRKADVETVMLIKHLLYEERYSIEGAKKKIRELKRHGDLKSFKNDKILTPVPKDLADPSHASRRQRILEVAAELQALIAKPVSDFFRC